MASSQELACLSALAHGALRVLTSAFGVGRCPRSGVGGGGAANEQCSTQFCFRNSSQTVLRVCWVEGEAPSPWVTAYPGEEVSSSGCACALRCQICEDEHVMSAGIPEAKERALPLGTRPTICLADWTELNADVQAWAKQRVTEENLEATRRWHKSKAALLQALHITPPPLWATWVTWMVRLARLVVLGAVAGVFFLMAYPGWDQWAALVWAAGLIGSGPLMGSSRLRSTPWQEWVPCTAFFVLVFAVAAEYVRQERMISYALFYWPLALMEGAVLGSGIYAVRRWVWGDNAAYITFVGSAHFTANMPCVSSWPGDYAGPWDELVDGARNGDREASVVFLPLGTQDYGRHCRRGCCGGSCRCTRVEEGVCWCAIIYAGRKDCGCTWFSRWLNRTIQAFRKGAILQVFFKAGMRGRGRVSGKRPFDSLADHARRREELNQRLQAFRGSELLRNQEPQLARLSRSLRGDQSSQRDREIQRLFVASLNEEDGRFFRDSTGLGNSQRAEVAYLDQHGIPYEEKDVREWPSFTPSRHAATSWCNRRQLAWALLAATSLLTGAVPTYCKLAGVLEREAAAYRAEVQRCGNHGDVYGSAQECAARPPLFFVPGMGLADDCPPCRCRVGMLLECPSDVRELKLRGCGIAYISPTVQFPQVKLLALEMNLLGQEGTSALSRASLPEVGTLTVLNNALGSEGASALAHATLPKLHALGLGRNGLGPEAISALSRASWLQGLTVLDLHSNALGEEGARALSQASFKKLRVLLLDNTALGPEGAGALSQASWLPGLVELHLDNNALGSKGASALSNASLSELQLLTLPDNNLGRGGASALSRAWLPKLWFLWLGSNALGPEGVRALSGARWLPQLRVLWLGNNALGQEVANALAQASLSELRVLGLDNSTLSPEGASALFRVPSLPELQLVWLSKKALGPQGVGAVSSWFPALLGALSPGGFRGFLWASSLWFPEDLEKRENASTDGARLRDALGWKWSSIPDGAVSIANFSDSTRESLQAVFRR